MKRHAALLPLVASIVFAAAHSSASTSSPASSAARPPEPAIQTQILKEPPPPISASAPDNPGHLFTVNDKIGPLLTCIAPDLDTNPDTDLFKSCTLAPGRTLDDVMHTFVQGIHAEQAQHQQEIEDLQKDLEDKTAQKPIQKQ